LLSAHYTLRVTRDSVVTPLLFLPTVVRPGVFLEKGGLRYRVSFSLQHNLHSIFFWFLHGWISQHFCQTSVYRSSDFTSAPFLPSFKLLPLLTKKKLT